MQLWEGNDPLDYSSMVPKPYAPPPLFEEAAFHVPLCLRRQESPSVGPVAQPCPGNGEQQGGGKRKERKGDKRARPRGND